MHRFFVPVSAQEDPKRFAAWVSVSINSSIAYIKILISLLKHTLQVTSIRPFQK